MRNYIKRTMPTTSLKVIGTICFSALAVGTVQFIVEVWR